jgi:AraC family transcriptional regulator
LYAAQGETRRLLRARGLDGSVYLAEYGFAAETRLSSHRHERAKFCLVTRGLLREARGDAELTRSAGSVTFLAAEEAHGERFGGGAAAFSVELDGRWLERHDVGLERVRVGLRELPGAAFMVRRLHEELRRFDDVSPLEVEGITLELLAYILRLEREPGRAAPAWLLAVQDRIRQECARPLTLESLSREAGVAPARLSRHFRTHFALSVGQYIRMCRINLARDMMVSTELPLAAIAAAVGFWDQSHFTVAFRRIAGVTPARYRRSATR